MRSKYRAVLAAVLVVLYLFLIPGVIAATWSPVRGDSALAVRHGDVVFAGAGRFNGELWAVLRNTKNSSSIIWVGGDAWRVDGLRASVACTSEWGIAVAGMVNRTKTVDFFRDGRLMRGVQLDIAARPKHCMYSGGVLAVLFSDPIVWDYLVLYSGGENATLVRLEGLPSQPLRVYPLSADKAVVAGKGYYSLVMVDAERGASIITYNVSVDKTVPTLQGASGMGERPVLYGYIPGSKDKPDRGIIYLPGKGWYMFTPVEDRDRGTRIRAVMPMGDGMVRVVVEVVGKETDIMDFTGSRIIGSTRISTLAPYILRVIDVDNGWFRITGDVFVKNETTGERDRIKVAYLLRSLATYSLAISPTDAIMVTGKGKEFFVTRLDNVTVTRLPPAGASLSFVAINGSTYSLEETSVSVKVYTAYVDRWILFFGTLAAMAAYFVPLAVAVYRYNNVEEERRA